MATAALSLRQQVANGDITAAEAQARMQETRLSFSDAVSIRPDEELGLDIVTLRGVGGSPEDDRDHPDAFSEADRRVSSGSLVDDLMRVEGEFAEARPGRIRGSSLSSQPEAAVEGSMSPVSSTQATTAAREISMQAFESNTGQAPDQHGHELMLSASAPNLGTALGQLRGSTNSDSPRISRSNSCVSNVSASALGFRSRLARLEEKIAALEARQEISPRGEWFEVVEAWAKSLPEVIENQGRVDAQRKALLEMPKGDWMRRMGLHEGWARRLQKGWPEKFDTVTSFVGLLMPALEMVRAMALCATPVQKVRLWTEAMLEAAQLIKTHTRDGECALGGDDLPSLVLFLVCNADCDDLVAQVQVAKLFILDDSHSMEYELHPKGYYQGLCNQYVFDAERRCIDPVHNIMWVDDALGILYALQESDEAEEAEGRRA